MQELAADIVMQISRDAPPLLHRASDKRFTGLQTLRCQCMQAAGQALIAVAKAAGIHARTRELERCSAAGRMA